MKPDLNHQVEYYQWIQAIKEAVRKSQVTAALNVNWELLQLYWHLGHEILQKEKFANWGDGLVSQLSKDLMQAFPSVKGFSRTNLFYIRKWVDFYLPAVSSLQLLTPEPAIVPQVLGQIPWSHHREVITHCDSVEKALFYVRETINNNWSKSVLVEQIKTNLIGRKGATLNNFTQTLPLPMADLARETLKNPYCFDFLMLDEGIQERDLEKSLINHIQQFLLELGQGFAYMGRQFPLKVGNSTFYLDLLFYHTKLRRYVVGELKIQEFQPEFVGKLNFYLNAVDAILKQKEDQPTLGLLLCKTPDTLVVDYSLHNVQSPLGVSEYQLTKSLPGNLQQSLPTIEALENELKSHL